MKSESLINSAIQGATNMSDLYERIKKAFERHERGVRKEEKDKFLKILEQFPSGIAMRVKMQMQGEKNG